MKIVTYEGNKYLIEDSLEIITIGDVDENSQIVYINKYIPKKFIEGMAIHEIEERKLINKGYTYTFSHNEAQKKELEFYESKFGDKEKALLFLKEEEKYVILVLQKQLQKELEELNPFVKEETINGLMKNHLVKNQAQVACPLP